MGGWSYGMDGPMGGWSYELMILWVDDPMEWMVL